MRKVPIVVGFDQREAIAYHVFCQSVIERTSIPVQFLPLQASSISEYIETHVDGSNAFIYSRFLTPYLMDFSGWAIFADGDMVCNADLRELWDHRDDGMAVMVVKHDYQTKAPFKYLGNRNENYPRKNWSSLVLWNCGHPSNKVLTPNFVQRHTGAFLHRFSWLEDREIGDIPLEWNWLAIEYEESPSAKLIHYTLGTPCFKDYENTDFSDLWLEYYKRALSGMGV